jgi:hypothetical protein
VVRPHDEPPLVAQSGGDVVQEAVGRLLDRTAHLAHQVLVEVVDEVVHGPTVAEVDVFDQARVLERLERAVHGRPMDAAG